MAYIPFRQVDAQGALQPVRRGTLMVRTFSANPRAMAVVLSLSLIHIYLVHGWAGDLGAMLQSRSQECSLSHMGVGSK